MARPPRGPKQVESLQGSAHAKRRLRVILETITGQRRIASACEVLGINEAAFHKLRQRTLQEAVEGLEPRPLGRPRQEPTAEEKEISALQEEIHDLKRRLHAASLREEIRATMPHVLKEERRQKASGRKKTTRRKRKRK